MLFLLTAAPLIAWAAPPAEPDLQADLDSLVAAERAFSKTSEEQGTKAAFLANLAYESILFRPGPVLARPWTEERPALPGLLLADDFRVVRNGAFPVIGKDVVRGFLTDRKVAMSWEPAKAGTSRAGDFGYTYGSYDETPAAGQPEKGHYLRIWKKQGGDAWKLVL